MISEFISSWDLFRDTYLAGWGIAVVLSVVGCLVIVRNQIFLGAAVSQASTLGIAAALALAGVLEPALGEWVHSDVFPATSAVVFSVLAAVLTDRGGRSESREAVTGWVFLVSASVSILIVTGSPHGIEEVHNILFSTIIGSTPTDVAVFLSLAGFSVAFVLVLRRRILLVAIDPEMAAAVGLGVRRWTLGLSLWLGAAVGLSMRVSGLLFTFGCLVLPALAAKSFCRELGQMFIVAPALGLVVSVVGFALAHEGDLPPGQMTVALLSAVVGVAWGWRKVRRS